MKKFSVCLSIILIIISVFSACNSTPAEGEATDAGTAATTQKAPIAVNPDFEDRTVGSVQTSEKYGGDKDYYIEYYDEDGLVTKTAVYENGRMVYYFTVALADIMGNAKQIDYYTPGGKFVATQKDGCFYDASGKQMSETEFENRLGL